MSEKKSNFARFFKKAELTYCLTPNFLIKN